MLNGIFVFLVLTSLLLAAWGGRMQELTGAMVEVAGDAVRISLGLIGLMALFLGLMRVAEDGGLLRRIARVIGPAMRVIFPGVPADHPAMSAMILNISSNFLGLGNAATPFGIKAMEELDKLNGRRGTATNAMVLFLAINTAGLALLPTTVIAVRASLESQDVAAILFPTWIASGCATLVGISAALLLSKLPRYRATEPPTVEPDPASCAPQPEGDGPGGTDRERPGRWRPAVAWVFWVAFAALVVRFAWQAAPRQPVGEWLQELLSHWVLPALVGALVLFGWAAGVRVYDSLVEGAREGFRVAVRIIPYLVAILVAVGMFRASGGVDLLVQAVAPWTAAIGMPAEALPMAILRPLSGSGALGVMTEIMKTHGPDSLTGYLVSTLQGSTETTFYVLAVYYGAVGVRHTRHTLPACLLADVAGILSATLIVGLLFASAG